METVLTIKGKQRVRKVKSTFRLPRITAAEKKEMDDRIRKYAEEMTDDFKIGYLLGQCAWEKMPTLSTGGPNSYNVIQVDPLDEVAISAKAADDALNKHLWRPDYEEWKKTPEWKALWDAYIAGRRALDKRFLPETYEYHCHILVKDTEELLKGLKNYLWNCDGCTYSLEDKDITFERDNFFHTTIIKFKRDKS